MSRTTAPNEYHFIEQNEDGLWYITGLNEKNYFMSFEEALEYANEKGITITRNR